MILDRIDDEGSIPASPRSAWTSSIPPCGGGSALTCFSNSWVQPQMRARILDFIFVDMFSAATKWIWPNNEDIFKNTKCSHCVPGDIKIVKNTKNYVLKTSIKTKEKNITQISHILSNQMIKEILIHSNMICVKVWILFRTHGLYTHVCLRHS